MNRVVTVNLMVPPRNSKREQLVQFSYRATKIRAKVTAKDESTRRGATNARSHQRAPNTVAHEGSIAIYVETTVEVENECVVDMAS